MPEVKDRVLQRDLQPNPHHMLGTAGGRVFKLIPEVDVCGIVGLEVQPQSQIKGIYTASTAYTQGSRVKSWSLVEESSLAGEFKLTGDRHQNFSGT